MVVVSLAVSIFIPQWHFIIMIWFFLMFFHDAVDLLINRLDIMLFEAKDTVGIDRRSLPRNGHTAVNVLMSGAELGSVWEAVEAGPLVGDHILVDDSIERGLMSAEAGLFDAHRFIFIYKSNKVPLEHHTIFLCF